MPFNGRDSPVFTGVKGEREAETETETQRDTDREAVDPLC